MADMHTDIQYIDGIGAVRAKALGKLGISTLKDLISYFPRTYEDRTKIYNVADLPIGEMACCKAIIATEPITQRISGGRTILRIRAFDATGRLDVTFFNQAYLKNNIHTGETYIFYGKVDGNLLKRQMTNPLMEKESSQNLTGKIMPIYPLTHGISQSVLSKAVRQGLDECRELMPDVLPDTVRKEHQLCYINYAYENIHFPDSFESLEIARKRMVFEELFLLTCGLSLLRSRRKDVSGPLCTSKDLSLFLDCLPFQLTQGQLHAIQDAISDMISGKPMNRLVQGDVGSGKTMVAAATIWFAHENGWQSALMAPTEILAQQHFETLSPLMHSLGIRCALLTCSIKGKARKELLENLANGNIDLCIGTHALLTEDVIYSHLGLVITDEQHRFGVNQRASLGKKAENPHMLVLSATPIPRTLALIIYGDLDVSIINELPPGRQTVDTFAVGEKYRTRVNAFIRKQVEEGHQVFVICPLVGDADTIPDERKAVAAYTQHLQNDIFPDLKIAMLHGKMKPKEKEDIMNAFASGESNILVSTTVVEVGVDIPNASLIIVENADCFGLSQLHQLRGRVGRGKTKSYCILISDNDSPDTKERLNVLTKTNDGFKISEADLKLRGPGDFFGQRQHGLPALKVADLECDMRLLDEAQQSAKRLIKNDPQLAASENRQLKAKIMELFELNSNSLN